MNNWIIIHPEVAQALEANQPVVALESTVISHGLPYPDNLTIARKMQNAIRKQGAIPATIAIIKGVIHVGLSEQQLLTFAQLPSDAVRKCSRRDLPIVVARGEDGATTVAGTMIVAHQVGIEVFATGGIGGVHRGHPFDISADLSEMGRTPVTVVCSGAKSILDLPATREVLETQGVTLVGYQTNTLPAFFSRSSGLSVDICADNVEEVAKIVASRRQLQLQSATLIGVPVPAESELDEELSEKAIARATAEADAEGIHGPAATPYLLNRLVELTDRASLRANLALLESNAAIAAQVAIALCAEENR